MAAGVMLIIEASPCDASLPVGSDYLLGKEVARKADVGGTTKGGIWAADGAREAGAGVAAFDGNLQGYLAHKKTAPHRTLQQTYA